MLGWGGYISCLVAGSPALTLIHVELPKVRSGPSRQSRNFDLGIVEYLPEPKTIYSCIFNPSFLNWKQK